MAEKVIHGAAIFKDAQGNTVKVQGLGPNDVNTLKQMKTDIEANKAAIAAMDQGQRKIALNDYYTDETHKDEMAVGVYYMVPFNASNEYLEWDMKTGKPKDPQTSGTVTDLKIKYFQIVFKNSDDVVNKLGRQDVQTSFDDVAFLTATQSFSGDNTFTKDVTMSAEQNVDSLGDDKLATAKFVRAVADKKINDAGHLKGSFSNTGEPGDDAILANQIVFYSAVDQL